MAFEKIPDKKRRKLTVYVSLNQYEDFILTQISHRLDLSKAETVRRLIEEDNERHHYDLIDPEWNRQRERELLRNSD